MTPVQDFLGIKACSKCHPPVLDGSHKISGHFDEVTITLIHLNHLTGMCFICARARIGIGTTLLYRIFRLEMENQ